MKIPEIRAEMDKLVEQLEELEGVVGNTLHRMKYLRCELVRRSPVSRSPRTATRMTASLANQIVAYRANHPKETQVEIANHFNVNPGRVSEVLAGFRT